MVKGITNRAGAEEFERYLDSVTSEIPDVKKRVRGGDKLKEITYTSPTKVLKARISRDGEDYNIETLMHPKEVELEFPGEGIAVPFRMFAGVRK